MRPYLAIIKDSFREALASRVLWILLILITVVFLAIVPVGWQRELTSQIFELRRDDEFMKRLDTAGDSATSSPEARIRSMLGDRIKAQIASAVNDSGGQRGPQQFKLQAEVLTEINELLARDDLYDEQAWSGAELSGEAQKFLDAGLGDLDEAELKRFNRLALEAAFPRHIRAPPSRSVVFSYLRWDVGVPLPMTDEQVREMIESWIMLFMYFFVGVVGLFSAVLVTASIIPNTFDAGSVNLLLSKPISRSLLYLSKFIGGCSFVLINATYLIIGTWLIAGFRLEIWNARLLLCIPVFLFLFGVYYSVSGLAGLIWRNTIVCIVVTILFWGICWTVGQAKQIIDMIVIQPNRIVRVFPLEDGNTLMSNENGQIHLWNGETNSWLEVFQTDTLPPFGSAFMQMRVGPVYDSANHRLVQTERKWPNFRLYTGKGPDWAAVEVGDAPGEMFMLLNEQDGRPLAVSASGISRFEDEIIPELERPSIFGFEIPVPTAAQGSYQEVPFKPALTVRNSTQVAISPTSGDLYVWNDGELEAFNRKEEGYERFMEATVSKESQRATLAAAGQHVVVAQADGHVLVLDAKSLKQEKSFQPAGNNLPRYVVASRDGRHFAVVFHSRELWVIDTESGDPTSVVWTGQGDVSAAAFASNGELLVADRGNRVTRYDLSDGGEVARLTPSGTLMQRITWYFLNPVYMVLPRPRELNTTTNYILTGKETVAVGGNVATLDTMHINVDPWTPVWASLAFTVVMLLVSCVYISRQEF